MSLTKLKSKFGRKSRGNVKELVERMFVLNPTATNILVNLEGTEYNDESYYGGHPSIVARDGETVLDEMVITKAMIEYCNSKLDAGFYYDFRDNSEGIGDTNYFQFNRDGTMEVYTNVYEYDSDDETPLHIKFRVTEEDILEEVQ